MELFLIKGEGGHLKNEEGGSYAPDGNILFKDSITWVVVFLVIHC